MAKKICNGVFMGGILLVLLLGLLQTVFHPRDIESYENRYAHKLTPLTLSGFFDCSWQEQTDLALADQVTFSPLYKKAFNRVSSRVLWTTVQPFLSDSEPRYVAFPPLLIYGTGNLVYYPRMLDAGVIAVMDENLANYNEAFARCPDVDFYVYYIQKDTDFNFDTGEKALNWEHLQMVLDLPAERMAALTINSFEDFSSCFYKTDHHWDLNGSYRGYREVMALLGVDEPLLEPLERVELGTFSGSKGAGIGLTAVQEEFSAYRFGFPAMEITANGVPVEDYGAQGYFLNGGAGAVSYSAFYGGDMGELVLDTGRPERENILILGESYDNAILKLAASHFNRTYSVDLRYYQAYMGREFRFSEYLAEHQISKVLLIGNLDFFMMPEFRLEG